MADADDWNKKIQMPVGLPVGLLAWLNLVVLALLGWRGVNNHTPEMMISILIGSLHCRLSALPFRNVRLVLSPN